MRCLSSCCEIFSLYMLLMIMTGYLYHVTSCLLPSFNLKESVSVSNRDILQTITKPLTKVIVQVNVKHTQLNYVGCYV